MELDTIFTTATVVTPIMAAIAVVAPLYLTVKLSMAVLNWGARKAAGAIR